MDLAINLSKDALCARVAERLLLEHEWLTIEAYADRIGATRGYVRGPRERGLPVKKVGKRLLTNVAEASAWQGGQGSR